MLSKHPVLSQLVLHYGRSPFNIRRKPSDTHGCHCQFLAGSSVETDNGDWYDGSMVNRLWSLFLLEPKE